MKHFLIPALFITAFMATKAQQPTAQNLGSFVGVPVGINMNDLINPNWKAQSLDAGVEWGNFNGIIGNAFYNRSWNDGYILLSDNRIAKNVSLKFNVYTNDIYFLHDSEVLVIAPFISVAEFGMYDETRAVSEPIIFRCGYPPIDNNNAKTFYHVLAGSKISLLKHYNKRIMETTNNIGAFERKFIDSESWYVYDTGTQTMHAIKKNKSSIEEALPHYAHIVEDIIKEKKLKIKSEKEWMLLINKLNEKIE